MNLSAWEKCAEELEVRLFERRTERLTGGLVTQIDYCHMALRGIKAKKEIISSNPELQAMQRHLANDYLNLIEIQRLLLQKIEEEMNPKPV
jgi:hypothetical protein